jgi:signal transduction histidine kinase
MATVDSDSGQGLLFHPDRDLSQPLYMRERAKLIGGHLDVWSKLNSGTEVELNIPATIAYRLSSGRRSAPSGE